MRICGTNESAAIRAPIGIIDAMLEIRNATMPFGVCEVRGVDPTTEPGDEAATLQQALAQSGVLVMRMDRKLEDDELQKIASRFGPIKDPIATTKDGERFRYSERRQIIDSGFVMTDEIRQKLGDVTFGGLDDERPGLFETFHCDDTYTAEPARVTVLHARQLPPSGGGPTHFLDMRATYEMLSESRKAEVADLRVMYAHNNHGAFPPRRAATGPADALEEVSHPLVRRHPQAGTRAIFLDLDRATRVENRSIEEGRALLQSLQDHAEKDARRCEHDWHPHDVLAWDNASVQHKAAGNFPIGESRRFWRYMVLPEKPV
jgi:alpha-ketoglutarate-dependent taurine dioxygenase